MDKGKIQNPLTIIAIFAGIAEVAGTTVLLGLPVEIQRTFVWFVILFPFVLIGAFFMILAFNHKVLYAPSDFNNEQLFVDLLVKNKYIQNEISELSEIVNEAKEEITSSSESETGEKETIVKDYLNEIQNKLTSVTEKSKDYEINISPPFSLSKKLLFEAGVKIRQELKKNPEGLTFQEMLSSSRLSSVRMKFYLDRMVSENELELKDGKYYIKRDN